MSKVEQPVFGQLLAEIRGKAKNGKNMGRTDFAALLGITPTQVRNIEQGRTLRGDEYDRIVQRFPEIEAAGAATVAATTALDAALSTQEQPRTEISPYRGQKCMQCQAPFKDDGTVRHNRSCPTPSIQQPTPPAVPTPPDRVPYCNCMTRHGWTNVDGDWVCPNCRRPSKMVYEQRYAKDVERAAVAFDVPAAVIAPELYGELIALDDEPEDLMYVEGLPSTEADAKVCEPVACPPPLPLSNEDRPLLPVLYFSNSEIQTFKRCRRKWWLRWYRGLELRAQDPVGALAIGKRVHRALQAWYVPEGETPVSPLEALETAIRSDWEACKQAYAEAGRELPSDLISEFNNNTALERAMIEGYMSWIVTTGVDAGLRVVAPETYLEVPLEIPESNVDVRLIGKIDVRMVREIDGVRLFVDHKTTASLTEPLKTIRLDEQMLHYHVLEWLSDVEGKRCDGALYNMLRKVKRTARATPPFYDRVEVRHNIHELEAFRKRLVGVIKSMVDVRARLDAGEDPAIVAYPTPNKDCSWSCDFLPMCPMFDDGSRVNDMLEHYYKVGNPLSYYDSRQ